MKIEIKKDELKKCKSMTQSIFVKKLSSGLFDNDIRNSLIASSTSNLTFGAAHYLVNLCKGYEENGNIMHSDSCRGIVTYYVGRTPVCPECASKQMSRRLSQKANTSKL